MPPTALQGTGAEAAPLTSPEPGPDGDRVASGQASAQEEGAAAEPSSQWRSATSRFASALRRAFTRPQGEQAERLASADPDGDAAPSSSSSSSREGGAATVPVLNEGSGGDLEAGQPSGSGSGSASRKSSGGSPRPSGSAPSQAVCLICLEVLTSEDFRSGKAISLDCQCRGELALRHKECAVQWARVKGDLVCELCKQPVRNLPALPAPPPPPEGIEVASFEDLYLHPEAGPHVMDLTPSHTDLVFDCFRVTWVAMIVSVLFFEMDLGAALWTGLLAGLAYSFMVRLMYRQHFGAMQRMAAEQHLARQHQMHGLQPHAIPVITVV